MNRKILCGIIEMLWLGYRQSRDAGWRWERVNPETGEPESGTWADTEEADILRNAVALLHEIVYQKKITAVSRISSPGQRGQSVHENIDCENYLLFRSRVNKFGFLYSGKPKTRNFHA